MGCKQTEILELSFYCRLFQFWVLFFDQFHVGLNVYFAEKLKQNNYSI